MTSLDLRDLVESYGGDVDAALAARSLGRRPTAAERRAAGVRLVVGRLVLAPESVEPSPFDDLHDEDEDDLEMLGLESRVAAQVDGSVLLDLVGPEIIVDEAERMVERSLAKAGGRVEVVPPEAVGEA